MSLIIGPLAGSLRRKYWHRVLTTRRPNLLAYWPLWETSGTAAQDLSGNARHGIYESVTLAQPGIGDNRTAPAFTAGAVNLYSTSLRDAFNGDEGSFACWAKLANAGVWTDGATRYIVQIYSPASSLRIVRSTAPNYLQFVHMAISGYATNRFDTGWLHVAMTWSRSNNRLRCYLNGSPIVADLTGMADWGANLPQANLTCLGTLRRDNMGNPWSGGIAHAALWNAELAPLDVQRLHDALHPTTGVFFVGDSKSSLKPWTRYLLMATSTAKPRYEERPLQQTLSGGTLATILAQVQATIGTPWQTAACALVNIGANDVSALPAEAAWKANLVTLIDLIRSKLPGIRVYIVRPWRRGYSTQCNTLATWISAVVATYPANVYLGMDERIWLSYSPEVIGTC